ncbi:MAG: rhomboid family intramembrane serine protease, partial [Planctomycetota bacterium]
MRSAFESQPTLLQARVIFTAIFIAGAVFVLGLQGKSFNEFAIWYGVWPEKPWLFLTTTLLHANFLHVGFNLYWMWGLGAQVEEQYGSLRTLGLFLLFAIGPSAAEWAFFGAGIG